MTIRLATSTCTTGLLFSLAALLLSTACKGPRTFNAEHGARVESSAVHHGLDAFGPIPGNLTDRFLTCPVADSSAIGTFNGKEYIYTSIDEVDFHQPGWQHNVSSDWNGLNDVLGDISKPGRGEPVQTDDGVSALVIDMKRVNGRPAYLYLANNGRQNAIYEPWSSSKFMAASAAMAKMRSLSSSRVGGDGKASSFSIGDMVTAIHSYNDSGNVPGASNEVAGYFLDLAGRKFASDLMHGSWLRIQDKSQFCDGYGGTRWGEPGVVWTNGNGAQAGGFDASCSGYDGGLGKWMSLLTMGEWLKRLAHHEIIPQADRMPGLQRADVQTLFYGNLERQNQIGGMLAGESVFVAQALMGGQKVGRFGSHGGSENSAAKAHFDSKTGGRWRIYHKLGAGPSSRSGGRAEIIMSTYACLPEFQGGREFVVVTRTSIPGGWSEARVATEYTEKAFNRIVAKLVPGFAPAGGQPQPAPQPIFPKWCKVQSSDGSANVRSDPSLSGNNVIKVLNNGASVKATRAQGTWYQVEFTLGGITYGEANGHPAWASSSLLSCP